MGTWSVSISGNDEFRVIYDTFRELYCEHDGKNWLYELPEIKKKMAETFSFQLNNEDIADDFWFAQAKAFWDFGIKDDPAFDKVKKIISSGSNLEVWRRLEAKEKDIPKRKKALDEFLSKISKANPKPFKRGKVVNVWPPFGIGDLLTFQDDKKNYYGAVITHAYHDTKGRNVVHLLNYRSTGKPARDDLVNADLMVHDKELKQYPVDGRANPTYTNLHGFFVTMKGFSKSKLSFEKIDEVAFHEYGYFRDGLRSYWDMTKYTWDILPELAALNYQEKLPDRKSQVLLRFYTSETSVSNEELAEIIISFKTGKKVTILSQLFEPKNMFAWASLWNNKKEVYLYIAIRGFNKMNTYLVKNILSRVFGSWLKSRGLVLDTYYFSVEEFDDISDSSLHYYKKLGDSINDIEQKGK